MFGFIMMILSCSYVNIIKLYRPYIFPLAPPPTSLLSYHS